MDELQVLAELNQAHLQQHIDNHIKIAELIIENKRLKAELSKSQRVTAIDNSFNGPDMEEVG